jgi:mycothiol synthase
VLVGSDRPLARHAVRGPSCVVLLIAILSQEEAFVTWIVRLDDALPEQAVSPGVAGFDAFESSCRAHDHHAPFDEHTLLSLQGLSAVPHARLTVQAGGLLAGCAVLTEGLDGWYVEVAVLPAWRRQGIGRVLVDATTEHVASHGGGVLRSWVHNTGGAAAALGRDARVGRTLLVLRRSLDTALPDLTLGTRSLREGERDAWLRLSNAAFQGHPENGGWTRTHLDWRVEAAWTSLDRWPVVEDAQGKLVAGVWTKVEPGAVSGELYVVAVDPACQGRGLGRAAVAAALHHLADAGCRSAHLYVDAQNASALALYAWAGFVDGEIHQCLETTVASTADRHEAVHRVSSEA